MSLKVYYTQPAKETLLVLYTSIQSKFGKRSADKFLLKVEKTVDLISEFPFMFKSSSIDEHVRIGLITKQSSVFYRVTDESITLLFFWDTRQEPFFTHLPE